ELVRMQQEPTSSLKAGRTPWDVLVEEAGAAIGGALTSNVLGRRGIGSRAGRAIVRHQRVTQAGQITLARRMRAVTVLTRLRAEVAASGEEVDERFRAGL